MAPQRTVNRMHGQVYIANESFIVGIRDGKVVTDGSGTDTAFHQGRTRANEADDVYKKYPQLFDRLEDHDPFEA